MTLHISSNPSVLALLKAGAEIRFPEHDVLIRRNVHNDEEGGVVGPRLDMVPISREEDGFIAIYPVSIEGVKQAMDTIVEAANMPF
jgi:hypothetical protein